MAARSSRSRRASTCSRPSCVPADEAALRNAHQFLARRARDHHPRRRPCRFAADLRSQPHRSSPTTTRCRRRARRRWPNYLAISLNVPEARVHVEGRGSDEPVNSGKDAASLAANRRVEIVIEGARFEANAPLELVKNGASRGRHRNRGRGAARSARRGCPRSRDTSRWPTSSAWAWSSTSRSSSPAIALAGARSPMPLPPISVDQDRDPASSPRRRSSSPSTASAVNPLDFDGVDIEWCGHRGREPLARRRPHRRRQPHGRAGARRRTASEVWRAERNVHFGGGPVRAEIDAAASQL